MLLASTVKWKGDWLETALDVSGRLATAGPMEWGHGWNPALPLQCLAAVAPAEHHPYGGKAWWCEFIDFKLGVRNTRAYNGLGEMLCDRCYQQSTDHCRRDSDCTVSHPHLPGGAPLGLGTIDVTMNGNVEAPVRTSAWLAPSSRMAACNGGQISSR